MPANPIHGIVPILCVKDTTRAIDFYRLLGFSAERYAGGDSYTFLNRGPWQLHLNQSDAVAAGENSGSGVYFYLAPGTAATLQDEFRSAGAPIQSPLAPREWKMLEFVVVDPDSNLLRFGEYMTAPSAASGVSTRQAG